MSVFETLRDRGFVQQWTEGARDLLEGAPTSFYVGFDPTADSMHAGHLLPVMAMAHLQRAGHRPIAVVGGGTGMVGDPSGKEEARQLLNSEGVAHNKACLKEQLSSSLISRTTKACSSMPTGCWISTTSSSCERLGGTSR